MTRQVLNVYKLLENKPVSKDSKLSWLQSKIEAIIDSEPKDFLNVVGDSAF
jgi:hypothetical protein